MIVILPELGSLLPMTILVFVTLANMNVGTWEIWKKVDDKTSCCFRVINRSRLRLDKKTQDTKLQVTSLKGHL